jgi:hypothetical protein
MMRIGRFLRHMKDVTFAAKLQDRIERAILHVMDGDRKRAKRASIGYRLFYEENIGPSPLQAIGAMHPRTIEGMEVWSAESAGMMYLDMIISVMKLFTRDNGTSGDPNVQMLLADLELVLAHMYEVQAALPEADGPKHYPINCEASRPEAERQEQVWNYILSMRDNR